MRSKPGRTRVRVGDRADAEDADRLAGDEPYRPALPGAPCLVAHVARQVAREREHGHQRRLRHRLAVHAAHVGDEHVLAQRRLVADAVDAGAQGLYPFQARRLLQHGVAHVRPEGDEQLGLADVGADLRVMVDAVDLEAGEFALQALGVLDAGLLGKTEKQEDVHGLAVSLEIAADRAGECSM
jgi:hypothetical protein